MPNRPFSREETWLFPPTLEELLPADHPARYVAAFVDGPERTNLTDSDATLQKGRNGGWVVGEEARAI